MPCPGLGPGVLTTNWLFQRYSGTNQKLIPVVFTPSNVREVVAGVQTAESVGGFLKAIGSQWSYSDVAVDDTTTHVMNTEMLKALLSHSGTSKRRPVPHQFPFTAVIPFALKDTLQPRQRYYVHVEAGIKIWSLNCILDSMRDLFGRGLAMPTLGGDNGQSLAGAISTATHGTHIDLPPIADAVRAIHLVGPGGQEWWIEREGADSITDPGRLAQAQQAGLLCKDIIVRYQDLLFRSVLVSMGRMGVVYSYVLEAVDAYNLHRVGRSSTWSKEQTTVQNIQSADLYFGYKDPWVEILVDPYADANREHACIVTTCDSAATQVMDRFSPQTPDPCATQIIVPILSALQLTLPIEIGAAAAAAIAGLSLLNLIPFVGPVLFGLASSAAITTATAALVNLQVAIANFLAASAEGDPGEGIANICNMAVDAGHKELIPTLIPLLMSFIRSPTEDELGESYRILTGQPACPQPRYANPICQRQIDGADFAVDLSAGKTNLFDFISDVFALTQSFYDANTPVGFAMSLRFTRKTAALLGMQQFTRTCSVEFAMLRGLNGQPSFLEQLYQVALNHGAIAHWGLMNELRKDQVSTLYPDLAKWQVSLAEIIAGGSGSASTFDSKFAMDRGLEPAILHTLPGGLSAALNRLKLSLQSKLARAKLMKRPQPN